MENVKNMEKGGRARAPREPHPPWPRVKLGEVCESKIARLKSLKGVCDIDYIDIASIDRESKRIIGSTKYHVAEAPGRAQQVVEVGDLLVSTVRPNLNAVALIEHGSQSQLIASTGFSVVRAKSIALPKYLFYYAQTDAFVEPLVAVSEKASYPSVTDTIVKDSVLSLPPLSVQRSIVARLERELGAVEKVAAKFEELEAAAEAEFKAELKETFEGLGAEKGNETHGTYATHGTKNACPLPQGGASVASAPCRMSRTSPMCPSAPPPPPWPRVKLGEVCECLSTRGHQIKQSEIAEIGRFPVVSQSENAVEGYTDSDIAITETPIVLFGDHTCIVKLIDQPFVVGADGVKLLKVPGCSSPYLFYWLRNAAVALLDGEYRRHFTDLCEKELPLPPLPVQRAIVAHLNAARERRDGIVAAAKRGREAAALWRKAILKEAFDG